MSQAVLLTSPWSFRASMKRTPWESAWQRRKKLLPTRDCAANGGGGQTARRMDLSTLRKNLAPGNPGGAARLRLGTQSRAFARRVAHSSLWVTRTTATISARCRVSLKNGAEGNEVVMGKPVRGRDQTGSDALAPQIYWQSRIDGAAEFIFSFRDCRIHIAACADSREKFLSAWTCAAAAWNLPLSS